MYKYHSYAKYLADEIHSIWFLFDYEWNIDQL